MLGQVFGNRTVLRLHHVDARYRKFFETKCGCGQFKIVRGDILKTHGSCGCRVREIWNRPEVREKHRQNLLAVNKLSRLPVGVASFNQAYSNKRTDAKRRGIPFSLSKEDYKRIVTGSCTYCGDKLMCKTETVTKNGAFHYTGIDRVKSSKGYEASNCIPCCPHCNIMKLDYTQTEFLSHVRKIVAHLEATKRFNQSTGGMPPPNLPH